MENHKHTFTISDYLHEIQHARRAPFQRSSITTPFTRLACLLGELMNSHEWHYLR